MHRLSASGRKRLKLCGHWARGDVALPIEGGKNGADLGSALHEAAAEEGEGLESYLRCADIDALAEKWKLSERLREQLHAMKAAWRAWFAEFSGGLHWSTEVAYAFDTTTGAARELGQAVDRHYDITETEIPGTTDACTLTNGGAVIVDIKTGRPPKRARDYIDQLMHTAICLRRIHGIDRARLIIAHVTTEDVFPDWWDVDDWDIDIAAEEMRRELDGIAGAEPLPGPHCSKLFCPLLPSCSATTRHLVEGLPMTGPVADPALLERYLDVLPRIEAWAEERRRACRAALDEAGGRIALPSGRIYRLADEQRESLRLDVPGAEKALYNVLGVFADEAIERKTSKSAVEAAARKKLAQEPTTKRGDLGRLKSEAIEGLRRLGAIKISKFRVAGVEESK